MKKSDLTSFDNKINDTNSNQEIIWTKSPLGYIEGYGLLKTKTAAHNPDGTTDVKIIRKGDEVNQIKTISTNNYIEKHHNTFKNIFGYNKDAIEDPVFLIFDLEIITNESPLFNNVDNFIQNYSNIISELNERNNINNYYTEFLDKLKNIFPTDDKDNNSNKRHYIESITGLDVLTKKIIDYPNDTLTIVLSEDITLYTHYMCELYNNLIYSYNTHRYLIPDNLLRFNLRITLKDIRNFIDTKIEQTTDKTSIADNVSKMVFILHDCQFDFFSSKSFNDEIINGGWGNQVSKTPAKNSVKINFKSFSKITAPLNINNSFLIDLKEHDVKKLNDYKENYDPNYKTNYEYLETININNRQKNNKFRSASDINSTINKPNITIGNMINGYVNQVVEEVYEVRDVIIKKIIDESVILSSKAEKWLYGKVGFTLSKVNVYYESLNDKIEGFSIMFSDILDKKVDNVLGRKKRFIPPIKSDNLYNDDFNNIKNKNINEKPNIKLHSDNKYNEKYPDGDLHIDNKYNEKYPDGNIYEINNFDRNNEIIRQIKKPNGNINKK